MKNNFLFTLLMFLALNVQADGWSGNANLMLGAKMLDDNDWGELDMHETVGVLVDFKRGSWPISVAIDILGSFDEETVQGITQDAMTSEFDFGVRKIWEAPGSPVKPFLGGGIAFVKGKIEIPTSGSTPVDDTGTGYWLNGGIYSTFGQHFNLGIQARFSSAEITSLETDIDAGGFQTSILIGYRW